MQKSFKPKRFLGLATVGFNLPLLLSTQLVQAQTASVPVTNTSWLEAVGILWLDRFVSRSPVEVLIDVIVISGIGLVIGFLLLAVVDIALANYYAVPPFSILAEHLKLIGLIASFAAFAISVAALFASLT